MKPVLEGRTEDSRVEALSTTAMVEGDSKEEGEKTPSMDPPPPRKASVVSMSS